MSLAIKSEHSTMSVEWVYVEVLVEEIAKRIKRREMKFDNIIGLSRGGLVPGVMLSHALGVNFISLVVCCVRTTSKSCWSEKLFCALVFRGF